MNQPTSPLINGSDRILSKELLLWKCRSRRRTICKVKRCLLKRRFHVCSRLLSQRKTISKGEQNLLRNCHGVQTIYRIFLKQRNVVRNLLRATPNALLLKRHQAQTAARSNFFQPHARIVPTLEVHFDAMAYLNFITGATRQFHTWWHTWCFCSLEQVVLESISTSVSSKQNIMIFLKPSLRKKSTKTNH